MPAVKASLAANCNPKLNEFVLRQRGDGGRGGFGLTTCSDAYGRSTPGAKFHTHCGLMKTYVCVIGLAELYLKCKQKEKYRKQPAAPTPNRYSQYAAIGR